MAPTRNATTAVRVSVTIVKRRDIVCGASGLPLHYKSPERLFIQRFDAELPGLFTLAPRIGSGDEVASFSC